LYLITQIKSNLLKSGLNDLFIIIMPPKKKQQAQQNTLLAMWSKPKAKIVNPDPDPGEEMEIDDESDDDHARDGDAAEIVGLPVTMKQSACGI
jgi:hypothetical protein